MKCNSIITVMVLSMAMSIFFSSCDEENVVEPSNDVEAQSEEVVLTPKTLATIELGSGTSVVFRSEEDGIVYEVSGQPDELDFLWGASMLERFLALTDASTLVPQDLLLTDENENLKYQAMQRGLTNQLEHIVYTKTPASSKHGRMEASCSGNSFSDTDTSDSFKRTYYGYPWSPDVYVYSSWKSGSNACKTINLYLVNCSLGYTMSVRTYYKNLWGNYVKQNTISIGAQDGKAWSKTYLSKRYRRVIISGNSPSGSDDRFSGYVQFKNYY